MSPATTSPKTGQHPPIYSLLRPYEDFPSHIEGATVWRSEDLKDKPESWVYEFSEAEIEELGMAADEALAGGKGLTEITKVGWTATSCA